MPSPTIRWSKNMRLVREQTWMIGNSPSSDINPALEAGLHAVFVPHRNTWMLERGELRPAIGNGRLLQVASFGHLRTCSRGCCSPFARRPHQQFWRKANSQ